jgi:Tol biopolymer transport system component
VVPARQPPDPSRRKIVAISAIFALALAGIGIATLAFLRDPVPGDVRTSPRTSGQLVFMGEKRTEYYSLFGIFTAPANGAKLNQLTDWLSDIWHPSWSSDGRSILFGSDGKAAAIYIMNPDGSHVRRFGPRGMDDLSPDETRIALSVAVAGTHRIVVQNVDGTDRRPITSPNPNEHHRDPVWSPEGSRILFERHSEDEGDLFSVNPDGSGLQPVTTLPGSEREGDWSPDRSRIVFVRRTPAGTDLYIIRSNGTGLRQLTDLRGVVKSPAWSPDGMRIAFEGGNLIHGKGYHFGIYTIRVEGTGLFQVTPSGETTFFEPAWQPWSQS